MTTIIDDYSAIRDAMRGPAGALQPDAGDRHFTRRGAAKAAPDLPALLEELKGLNRLSGPLSEAAEKHFDERMNYILAAFESSRAADLAGALAQLEFAFNPELGGEDFEEANAAIIARAITTIHGLACAVCATPVGDHAALGLGAPG